MDSNKASQHAKAMDGFNNLLSRTGATPGINNNQISHSSYDFNLLSRNRMQLEAMYRGSWVVGVTVDAIAEDMTRAGIKVTSNSEAQSVEDFNSGFSKLGIMNSLQDIIKWSRLYGGAIGVMMIDGQDLSTPLNTDRIMKGQFSGLAVYDRWQIQPDLFQVIRSGPDMGLPAYYTIITSEQILASGVKLEANGLIGEVDMDAIATTGGIRVHHSRVIRQTGIKLPYYQAITEMMWGMSEVERLYDRLVAFDNATMSAANLINHANLRTVAVDGLRDVMGTGGQALDGMMAFFDFMRLMQSNEGLTLIDKDDTFASTAYTFAGLSDMLLQFGQQLSGASGIPLVRFFGQSPAGMSATGESDFRMYYDNINSKQEASLRPPMEKLIKVVFQSLFGRPAPKDFQFTFVSLWQTTATEKANNGRTQAETITGVFDSGLIKKSTALKELRQASNETGLFTNVSDEDIVEAEVDEDSEDEMDSLLDIPTAPSQGSVIDSKKLNPYQRLIKKFYGKGKDAFKEENISRKDDGKFGSGAGGGSSKESYKDKPEYDVKKSDKKIKTLTSKIEKLKASSGEGKIAELQSKLSESTAKKEKLNKLLEESKARIAELKSRLK